MLLVAAMATALTAALALVGAPSAGALPPGAYWYTQLDLNKAWAISKGAGVTVAVIDSGVQASLGDLRGQVLPGLDLSGSNPGAQTDHPEKGTAKFGHGTNMAVLIAGTGQGAGMVGVAPQAKILPVDATDVSTGSLSNDYVQGVRWAVDHGAKVINLSLGDVRSCSSADAAAIAYAYHHDVIVVASAGDNPGPVSAPAVCPGAIAIGGIDAANKSWTDTPSGAEVDFVGPAFNLVDEELDGTLNGPFPDNAGTSASAAIVSGTFALLRSKFPHETARQIVTRALYNVHNGLGAGHQGQRVNDKLGYGEILPYFALTEAPPAGARNPIYDRFDAAIGTSGGGSSSSAGGPPVVTDPNGGSSSAAAAAGSSTDHGNSTNLTGPILTVVLVLVVAGVITFFVMRSRRARAGSFGPPGR